MIFYDEESIMFRDEGHYYFYHEKVAELKADVYLKSLIYIVGICYDTRSRWSSFYDEKSKSIKPEVLNNGWQTGTTMRATRLALNLFTDGTPTARQYDEHGNSLPLSESDFDECSRYSVSDVFCCEFAVFFVEAVKLRYPEYFAAREVFTEQKKIVRDIREREAAKNR